MKIRCERDLLVDSLATVGRAVVGRGGLSPSRPGVLLEASGDNLHLVGHDGDLDLIIESDIKVAGAGEGSTVLPTPLATDIVRALDPGAVTVEADDDEARITGGRSDFTVRTFPVSDFPRVPVVEGEGISIVGQGFSEAMRQVVRAASADEQRPSFTGVLISDEGSSLRLVATDSYRLAFRDLEGAAGLGEGRSVLVPAKALSEVNRLVGGSATSGEKSVVLHAAEVYAAFTLGTVRLITRIIKSDFPEYRHLIPASYPNTLVIGREAFLDSLRRMRLLVKDTTATSVRISMGSEGVQLSATNAEYGRAVEDVDAKYDGADLTVAFNPSYLIDGVDAVRGEEVMVETVDETKPAMVRGVGTDDYHYLLMPVRTP